MGIQFHQSPINITMSQSHQSSSSHVDDRSVYEDGDQRNYNPSEVRAAERTSGINVEGYMDKNKIMNKLQDEEDQKRTQDRMQHEPGFAATMHGNEPSKGAKIDAELAEEEAEMLAKKKNKTGTDKHGMHQELDAEIKAERTAHSNSGSNTGQRGPEYVDRKNK